MNLTGENSDEWLNLVSSSTPSYVEEHQEAVEKVEQNFRTYILVYGVESENLVKSKQKTIGDSTL